MTIPTLNSLMGRFLEIAKFFYFPRKRVCKVRNFPVPAKFVLNPMWKGDLFFMIYGCPRTYREEFALLKSEGPYDGDIFDVGANMGSYSMYFYHLLKGSSIVRAFEPVPVMASKMKETAEANGYERLRIETVAVSDYNGTGRIYMDKNLQDDCGQSSLTAREDYCSMPVPVVTLDKYKDRKVALIKIDAEGEEEKVLRGAMEILKRDHPKIFFEISEKTYGTFSKGFDVFKKLLSPLGYKLYFVTKGRLIDGEEAIQGEIDDENWLAK